MDGPARRYDFEGTRKAQPQEERMTHRLANPRGHARPAPPSTSRVVVVVVDALLRLLCLVRAGPPPEASRQWHPPRPASASSSPALSCLGPRRRGGHFQEGFSEPVWIARRSSGGAGGALCMTDDVSARLWVYYRVCILVLQPTRASRRSKPRVQSMKPHRLPAPYIEKPARAFPSVREARSREGNSRRRRTGGG